MDSSYKGSLREITGTLKSFDPKRGIGFVQPEDGSADVLIGAEKFTEIGIATPTRWSRLQCMVRESGKGLRVERVLEVLPTEAGPFEMEVRFYNRRDGFGFLIYGDRDDFLLGAITLHQAGISWLNPGERLRAWYQHDQRGPRVTRVQRVSK